MVLKTPTRRDFLHVLGLVAGAGILGCQPDGGGGGGTGGGGTGGGGTAGGTGGGGMGGAGSIVVRGDVMGSGAGSVDSYRAAVAAMRALPGTDPRSWEAQATIHLDHCPHGNAFFLPWHRAYLQYFEEICRAMSGDPTFALPYWNWSTQPTIPPPFWTGTLNDTTREIGPTDPMPAWAVGQPVIDGILADPDFETFGSAFVPSTCTVDCQRMRTATGELEGTPHNIVHDTIGGNMATYMSPLDPIFWLHHCNVDRLWVEWNKSFADPANSFWRNFDFAGNFVDGAGNPVPSVVVQSLFDTFALGYRYDTQPEAEPEELGPVPTTASVVASVEVENTASAQMGAALTIPVQLSADVLERLAPGTEAMGETTVVRLSLGGLATPDEPVLVNVYLGGAGAPASTDSPNYVRSFGFFPAVAADDPHHHEKTFLFNVGAKLAALEGGSAPVHVETQPLRAGIEAAGPGVAPKSVKIEVIELS